MRAIVFLIGLILFTVLLYADEQSVDFDQHTDFSKFKTFALLEGRVNSPQPELNNRLVLGKVADAIRRALAAKGLKDTANSPDIAVNFSITAEDFGERRGGPPSYSQATLVIDLLRRDTNALVWRVVYRDNEKNNAKLAQKLPEDVKKALSEYPPKQKGVIEQTAVPLPPARFITPSMLVTAVYDLIRNTRQDTAYVGGAEHPGLGVSLNNLERAARAVESDDGRNAAISKARMDGLLKAAQETADFAMSIANRPSETPNSKAKSRDLAAKLHALIGK